MVHEAGGHGSILADALGRNRTGTKKPAERAFRVMGSLVCVRRRIISALMLNQERSVPVELRMDTSHSPKKLVSR